MEADLRRYYGIVFAPLWRELMHTGSSATWRELAVLVQQLPPGCALERSQDPEGALWSLERWLLAHNADLLATLVWLTGNQGVEKSKQTPFPDRIIRPGVTTPTTGNTEGMDPKMVASFLIQFAPKEVDDDGD